MKIEDLFTRQHAEAARRLPVLDIEGHPTDHWMEVLGSESAAFITARAKYMRERLQSATDEMEGNDAEPFDKEMAFAEMMASIVTGWSFETEFTPDNVVKLLYNAPYLSQSIEEYCYTKANKPEAVKQNSSTTPAKASN